MAGVLAMVKKDGLEELRKGLFENIFNIEVLEQNDTVAECGKSANVNRVILFFSFDVVNSTKYKSINYYGWSYVLNKIFEILREKVYEKMQNAELWRVLGDEIIFIVPITEREVLGEYVAGIYAILLEIAGMIDDGSLFDEIEYLDKSEKSVMKGQHIISLQAAAWIGVVTDGVKIRDKSYQGEVDNVLDIFEEKGQGKFYEFIGNDIDAGFRIQKFTRSKRLILSFELAYLIAENEKLKENLYIITYKRLKGIWQERLYPIIWYYSLPAGTKESRKLGASFPYDMVDEDNLYQEYFTNRSGKGMISEPNMFLKIDVAFEKLIRDQNLKEKIHRLKAAMEDSTNYMSVFGNPLLELHCVAVCLKRETKEIFIVKRTKREPCSGCWEFGCAKANPQQTIPDSIQDEYKRDFGLGIKLIVDQDRKESLPVPIAVYQIQKKDSLHKGMIFLAEIENDAEVHCDKEKHCEWRYIKEEELAGFEEEAVQDFKDTLRKGFRFLNEG